MSLSAVWCVLRGRTPLGLSPFLAVRVRDLLTHGDGERKTAERKPTLSPSSGAVGQTEGGLSRKRHRTCKRLCTHKDDAEEERRKNEREREDSTVLRFVRRTLKQEAEEAASERGRRGKEGRNGRRGETEKGLRPISASALRNKRAKLGVRGGGVRESSKTVALG